MAGRKSFGARLRELRIAVDKSMGKVAREIGVSTVYYSEVENGKKPPFPVGKVDYGTVASALDSDQQELERIAFAERGSVKLKLDSASKETKDVALLLARRLNDDSLSKQDIERIRKILGDEKEGKDVPG